MFFLLRNLWAFYLVLALRFCCGIGLSGWRFWALMLPLSVLVAAACEAAQAQAAAGREYTGPRRLGDAAPSVASRQPSQNA